MACETLVCLIPEKVLCWVGWESPVHGVGIVLHHVKVPRTATTTKQEVAGIPFPTYLTLEKNPNLASGASHILYSYRR